MDYIIETFNEYVYEPVSQYIYENYYYDHNDIKINLKNIEPTDDEIKKIIDNTIQEIKDEKQVSELQIRYNNLIKEDSSYEIKNEEINHGNDDNDDDDNNNAVSTRQKILIKN